MKFNLSRRNRAGPSWLRMAALFAMTGLFCSALLVAFDREEVRQNVESGSFSSHQHFSGEGEAEPSPIDVGRGGVGGMAEQHASYVGQFGVCGRHRFNCVVDGDTLWLDGVKVRLADIDAPEIGRPRCLKELELGRRATMRLVELLNKGEFAMIPSDSGDVDRYGRKLRVIVRGDDSLGEQLVQEGLAHRWAGRKLPWC